MSPGVSLEEPIAAQARARGIEVLGDIELFARAVSAPVIGITGTNGKSTVTSLVASMAAAAGRRVLAGGNLGRPALDLLAEPVPDLYVLELSSFQLETTRSLDLIAAVVLNVTSDHMDRYASIEAYAAGQAADFRACGHDGAECRRSAGRRDARRESAAPAACLTFSLPSVRMRTSRCYARGPRVSSRGAASPPAGDPHEDLRPSQRRQRARGAGARRGRGPAAAPRCLSALETFPGLAAPLAVGRRHRRRALRRRFQGHERRRDPGRGSGMHGPAGADRRRRGQGPGFRSARGGVPRQGPARGADRQGRAGDRPRPRTVYAHSSARDHAGGGARGRRGGARPATRCCSRRPARVSTCSATTPIAATCSPRRCARWREPPHERHDHVLRHPGARAACLRVGWGDPRPHGGAPAGRARHGHLRLHVDRRQGPRRSVLLSWSASSCSAWWACSPAGP